MNTILVLVVGEDTRQRLVNNLLSKTVYFYYFKNNSPFSPLNVNYPISNFELNLASLATGTVVLRISLYDVVLRCAVVGVLTDDHQLSYSGDHIIMLLVFMSSILFSGHQ